MAKLRRTELEIEGMKAEPRLARAFERAMRKIRRSVSIYELGNAIQAKDMKLVMSMITESAIRDALTPCVRIVEDASFKGGRVAVRKIGPKNG